MRNIWVGMTILVLFLGASGATAQDTFYFCVLNAQGNSGDWDVAANWEIGPGASTCDGDDATSVPGFADTAVIKATRECNIDSAAQADHIVVEDTAVLNVEKDWSLTLDGTGTFTSTIDGTLNLEDTGSTLIFIVTNQTLNGDGQLIGKHNAASILISEDLELTSALTIEGAVHFAGTNDTNKFINQGTVDATLGNIHFEISDIEDVAGANWNATGSGGVLWIDVLPQGHPPANLMVLEGDFLLTNGGRLLVEFGVTTSGTLTVEKGKVINDSNKSLVFSSEPPP